MITVGLKLRADGPNTGKIDGQPSDQGYDVEDADYEPAFVPDGAILGPPEFGSWVGNVVSPR